MIRRILLAILLSTPLLAAPVRIAPEFTWAGPGGTKTLRSLRGQPVVLLLADSQDSRTFRSQIKKLRDRFDLMASKEVIVVAALKQDTGPIQSNIPVVIANNGPAIHAAYDVRGDFAIAIIGKDGNLDYITDKPLTADRIRDVVQNSFAVQSAQRK